MVKFVSTSRSGDSKTTLVETGVLVPVSITVPVLRKRYLEDHIHEPHLVKHGYALVDTGASQSAVDDRVMLALDVPALDQAETLTPHGAGYSNVYNASASLSAIGLDEVELEGCFGCYLGEHTHDSPEVIMLIGRDLLSHCVLTYDGPNSMATTIVTQD